MTVWALYFGWPDGAVWPNLLASAITSSLTAALLVHRALKKMLERERVRRAAELAEHHQAVTAAVAAQLAEHHQAVLAAVRPREGAS